MMRAAHTPLSSSEKARIAFRSRFRCALFTSVALIFTFYFLSSPPVLQRRFAPRSTPADAARRAAAILERPVIAPLAEVAQPAKQAVLLSVGRPASADVSGNLADASVLTRAAAPGDWLTDRWQAASDMSGTPIPGEHWVQVDLERASDVDRVVLVFETAFSKRYTIQARLYEDSGWATVGTSDNAVNVRRSAQQVVHDVAVMRGVRTRYVRVILHEPATQWGVSLWRVECWGRSSTA